MNNTQASINYSYPKIKVDMLVRPRFNDSNSIGIVVKLTKKFAHVCWLVNDLDFGDGKSYHQVTPCKRAYLEPMPLGVKVTLQNKVSV